MSRSGTSRQPALGEPVRLAGRMSMLKGADAAGAMPPSRGYGATASHPIVPTVYCLDCDAGTGCRTKMAARLEWFSMRYGGAPDASETATKMVHPRTTTLARSSGYATSPSSS
eukprot:scaffold220784_cov32-Tisochrysis_lutea.AAC.6